MEKGASESLESSGHLGLAAWHLVMESCDTDVFLAGALLGLDESRSAVDADDWEEIGVSQTHPYFWSLGKYSLRHPVTLGSRVPEWPVFWTLQLDLASNSA